MASLLRRFYSVESMVKPEIRRGEIPSTSEAYSQLIHIALPSVLEMVLTSLIGSVDTMMVGTLGTDAIAAVGLTGQPRMLMLCIFFALNTGVTAVVARRKGQGMQKEANATLRTAIIMILALCVVMMVAALSFSRPLILAFGAQPETVDMAVSYFNILAWFLPINALTMCINAAQRGVGNTRLTMYVNIVANLVNVVFNFLLIGGNFGFPKLGVDGAAYATGIGFTVGFVLCIAALLRGRKQGTFLSVSVHDDWRFDRDSFRAITKVGGNAVVEQIFLRIGFATYAIVVASLGTNTFAAHQVAMQFLNLSFTFGDGIGVASTSLVGQMLGKERPDLSVMFGKCAQRLAVTVALLLGTTLVVFRQPLVGLFADVSTPNGLEVFNIACNIMFVVAMFQPFQTTSVVISGSLRGAGDTKYVALVMMICVAVIRPLMSMLAVYVLNLGIMGAWCSSLIDMIIRVILVYTRFNGGKWHEIKV